MDHEWWDTYRAEVSASFPGALVTMRQIPGVRRERAPYFQRPGIQNSGAGAIALAAYWGAQRIVLLGYDCQHTAGRRHWHADHPSSTRGNAGMVGDWPRQFRELVPYLGGAEVINASRETALAVFRRQSLEQALA